MYEFVTEQTKNEFESFVMKNGVFTQSIKWADVKENWEHAAIVSRNGKGAVRAACLALIKRLGPWSLIYAPRGPVFSDAAGLCDITHGLDALAAKYRAFTVICDPLVEENSPESALLARDFKRAELDDDRLIQCRDNYVIKLAHTLEEIREGFKSDYRNRISKAQRRGAYCTELHGEKALNALSEFYPLMEQTGRRDGFPVRSAEYFERIFRSLGENAGLFMCYREIDNAKTPLSGAITVNYGGRFTYLYGASSDLWRELYPCYLMQWTMIYSAFDSGCEIYDFGGIPFWYDESRPEYGMYRFKKGFGGERVTYAGQYVRVYRRIVNRAASIFSGFLP